jgi:Fe-S-cluster-containing dehydrogenase component
MPSLSELPVSGSATQAGFSRRDALRLLAAGVTSGLAACGRPDQEIVPYIRMPEGIVPGEPLKFASALPLSGYGRGVVVTSIDGRPIKVEGNPRHPASLGATDVFAEAAVLSLYDPDRSRTALKAGEIVSWESVRQAIVAETARWRGNAGAGLRLLTGRVTSPTLARQIEDLLATYPGARWHAYEPADDAARDGANLAFGRPLQTLAHLDRAGVVLTLDADPIGHGPDQLRHARGFAARRVPRAEGFSRIYAVETAPTLTGAKADHRVVLHPRHMLEAAIALANLFGAGLREAVLPPDAAGVLAQAAADLKASGPAGLVLGGSSLTAEAHALLHWVNARLGAPIDLIEPPRREPASLADLTRDLAAGTVGSLVILGANPAYDGPADLGFAKAAARAPFRLHAGIYADESAALATWHVPLSHPLEAWSDLAASDGTAAIVQPLIRPLYGTWTDHQLLAALLGQPDAQPYDLVRDTWRGRSGANFEAWWAEVLHDGIVPGSAARLVTATAPRLPDIGPPAPEPADGTLTIVLQPDPSLWDGAAANNAWLQECPKPLTKQVWGNALALGPDEARHRSLEAGDVVRVEASGRELEVAIDVVPGLPAGVAALTLGYGRSRAGAIGTGIGASAYRIRTAASPWVVAGATLTKTGRHEPILRTHNVVRTREEVDELYPLRQLGALGQTAAPPSPIPSLLPEQPRGEDGYAWAMVIDASLCIGCNACVVACQSENNVPVVGPEEVARGRDMHWLRVDVYDHGSEAHPKPGFQPVPCMHCEHAPCEPVCPVAASVHDREGLNLQVYNRCIGTRFCEANCPYKVRRFNFFGYADGQEYANLGLEAYRAQRNPEVTVRARGVMEKCTYCVQRISGARRSAEREGRHLGPEEVTTACQNACPTRAITFGDLHQPDAVVTRLRQDERHYALLGHLGTRPRTTYLADLRNPAPELPEDHA